MVIRFISTYYNIAADWALGLSDSAKLKAVQLHAKQEQMGDKCTSIALPIFDPGARR